MKITPYTKIDELLTAKKIKLYTYQSIKVLSQLEANGYITGEHDFSYAKEDDDPNFPTKDFFGPPYEWMRKQMVKRIKNFSGDLPVWAWVESRGNINVKKSFGEDQVKLTVNVPLSRCLISDFDMFECGAMNKGYFSINTRKMEDQYIQINEEEYEKDHKAGIKYKFNPTQAELEKGWEMMFDLSKYIGTRKFRELLGIEKTGRYLQVCIDRIYQDEIEHIKVYDNNHNKRF